MDLSLSRIEARLQRLIEEGTARLFAADDGRSRLAARLVEALQAEVKFANGGKLLAPAIYIVQSAASQAESLNSNLALKEALATALQQAAADANIELEGEPVLHVAPDESLEDNQFCVQARWLQRELADTQSLELNQEEQSAQIPGGAFLIVGGSEIFPLNQAIINIGRKKDNHLVLDSPQISRRHAQLRAINGAYHFFDLGSTGGSKVNGERARSATLMAGDVINLAGTPLIYGQDTLDNPAETQEMPLADEEERPTAPNPDESVP